VYTSDMETKEKHCVLMFDEISLSPGLLYNSRTDSVEGFVDYFMVKGIYKKWKQMFLLYFFCKNDVHRSAVRNFIRGHSSVAKLWSDCFRDNI
jgi:hypothetical protein